MNVRTPNQRWALGSVCLAIAGMGMLGHPAAAQNSKKSPQSVKLALASSLRGAGQEDASERASGLAALLRQSVGKDPSVRSAVALEAAAKDRLSQAQSRLLPVLAVQVQHGNAKVKVQENPERRKTDRAHASLSWNVFNGGLDGAEIEAAEREADAAFEDVRRAREEVSERIAQAYAQALRFHELLPESGARLDRARQIDQQVFTQVAAGKLSDLDGVQSAVTLLEAEIDHAELHSEAIAAVARLSEMTGLRVDLTAGWPSVLSEPAALTAGSGPQPGVLTAAELRAEAAHNRVPSVAALYAPKIDLQYEHQLHDRAVPQLLERQRNSWGVFARWEIPLGGERHAQRSEVSHRAQAADEEVARVHQSLRSELAGMPGQIRTTESAITRLQEQVQRYKTLVNAGALQFEAGRRNLEQLAQMGQNSFAAHRRLAEERLKLRTTVLRQLALSGGLLGRLGIEDINTAASQ